MSKFSYFSRPRDSIGISVAPVAMEGYDWMLLTQIGWILGKDLYRVAFALDSICTFGCLHYLPSITRPTPHWETAKQQTKAALYSGLPTLLIFTGSKRNQHVCYFFYVIHVIPVARFRCALPKYPAFQNDDQLKFGWPNIHWSRKPIALRGPSVILCTTD